MVCGVSSTGVENLGCVDHSCPCDMALSTKREDKFCVIIPLYNEAGNVLPTIQRINQVLNQHGLRADIHCVDDGSTDATSYELGEAVHKWSNVVVTRHERNLGFGAARRTGMKMAVAGDYTYALFMDADLTMDPIYIMKFHEQMLGGYDFVVGSRYSPGGGMYGVAWYRRAVSATGNAVFGACFRLGLSDYTQGFRAIRLDVMKRLRLREAGFPILLEELIQARRLTRGFAEVPFVLTARRVGVSKFSYAPRVLLHYLFYAGKALVTSLRWSPGK